MKNIVLFGIGGYGAGYVRALAQHGEEYGMRVVAAVDPYPPKEGFSAPVFDTAEDFYASGIRADLAVISTPISLHEEMTVSAMRHGCDVLLEKPVSPDLASAERILAASRETGKMCSVGFQLCFDASMRALKRDIISGLYGKPVALKSITLWPRNFAYYKRGTGWAGRRTDAQGRLTLDSVASNATAHYLMNMLWILGEDMEGASPLACTSCYTARANDIETFDTVILEGLCRGIPVKYIASHAVSESEVQNPLMIYTFEKATIVLAMEGNRNIYAFFRDGRTKVYPSVTVGDNDNDIKLRFMKDALSGEAPLPCPIECAMEHVRAMDYCNAAMPEVLPATPNDARDGVYAKGLADRLREAFYGL
ncbi:MAG: Gfo/Idh/MocA family protein [Christensenellales bacterium]|jgi:predicted dehydrogenase